MTEKIYEYKDDQDWFIGQWDQFNSISGLGNVGDDKLHELEMQLRVLNPLDWEVEGPPGYQVTVVRLGSVYRLIRFVAEMIAAETGRALQVSQRAGAVIVTENDRVVMVQLPADGVAVADFFGQTVTSTVDLGDTILIATKNEGKTKEFRAFFAELGYQVENLNNYPDLPDVEETGMTFEENARLKAETIAKLTGKMVLADDSGLKVDKLGGLPGIWSARFGGPDTTDARNNAKLLHELSVVHEQRDRSAQFHCTLVMAAPGYDSLVVEADWHGYIATVPRGENGFGYDPLFLVGETGQTAAEMDIEEKNKQSHRAKALEKLLEAFPVWQQEQKSNYL